MPYLYLFNISTRVCITFSLRVTIVGEKDRKGLESHLATISKLIVWDGSWDLVWTWPQPNVISFAFTFGWVLAWVSAECGNSHCCVKVG